jgi:hypothetical protein
VKRRLFNLLAAVSAVLCLGANFLWARSYWRADQIQRKQVFKHSSGSFDDYEVWDTRVSTSNGGIRIELEHDQGVWFATNWSTTLSSRPLESWESNYPYWVSSAERFHVLGFQYIVNDWLDSGAKKHSVSFVLPIASGDSLCHRAHRVGDNPSARATAVAQRILRALRLRPPGHAGSLPGMRGGDSGRQGGGIMIRATRILTRVVCLCCIMLPSAGCAGWDAFKDINKHGGETVIEGMYVGLWVPPTRVYFDEVPPEQALTDDEFAAVFPSIKSLPVFKLSLANNPVSDRSAELIATDFDIVNLDVCGTQVTPNGLKRLAALPKLRSLHVSAESFTEDDLAGLRAALPGVNISRCEKDASGAWHSVHKTKPDGGTGRASKDRCPECGTAILTGSTRSK